MECFQESELKLVDSDIEAMLKLNTPPTEAIEKYIERMQTLIEETGSSSFQFGQLNTKFWTCRLKSLKNELQSFQKYNNLKKELSAMHFYIVTLFSTNPTSEEIKEIIDKLISKIKKIEPGSLKSKWTQIAESLLKDYIDLKSPQSSGVGSSNDDEDGDNDGKHFRSSSTKPAEPTFSTSKPTKIIEHEKESASAVFSLNNFNDYSNDYSNSSSRPESSHVASEKIQKPYHSGEYSSSKSEDISSEKMPSDFKWGQELKTVASTSQKPNYQSAPQNQSPVTVPEKQPVKATPTFSQSYSTKNTSSNGGGNNIAFDDDNVNWGAPPSTFTASGDVKSKYAQPTSGNLNSKSSQNNVSSSQAIPLQPPPSPVTSKGFVNQDLGQKSVSEQQKSSTDGNRNSNVSQRDSVFDLFFEAYAKSASSNASSSDAAGNCGNKNSNYTSAQEKKPDEPLICDWNTAGQQNQNQKLPSEAENRKDSYSKTASTFPTTNNTKDSSKFDNYYSPSKQQTKSSRSKDYSRASGSRSSSKKTHQEPANDDYEWNFADNNSKPKPAKPVVEDTEFDDWGADPLSV